MPAATVQATPAIPPRPARGTDKDNSAGSVPRIPPRPSKKRPDRSISPASERFAPSPLNEGLLAKKTPGGLLSPSFASPDLPDDAIDSARNFPMPSVGEEGMEYRAVAGNQPEEKHNPSSPEQTSTVAADLHLHAPKPSLPASSAKQRVAAVTRTDSDRAASFGIGRAHGEDRAVSRDGVKKKPSTSFSTTSDQGQHTDDDHGIPEIGQRVPMNPNLGDVQAPSPAPSEGARHHSRKHSARSLPPGSYGLHGHGVVSQDKLEKAYYQKHPEAYKREEHTPIHDRPNDYAMSSADLNKLVRDTASRGPASGSGVEFLSTPTDEVGFQASEEYATRIASPRPASRARASGEHRRSSSLVNAISIDAQHIEQDQDEDYDEGAIHVDDPKHPQYRSFGNETPAADGEDHDYHAPILASDEVSKDPAGYHHHPAVPPRPGSTDVDEVPSRPSSRPTSIYQTNSQAEVYQTPLEDVEEYEPLFPEESKQTKQTAEKVEHADENKNHNHFPSKDIWEDAPNSVHYTATVSTPDLLDAEHHKRSSSNHDERAMTPAQLFAKHQEELAEKEAKRRSRGSFIPLTEDKPKDRSSWAAHQSHLKVERPSSGPRFPSRDVWEDVPESQLYETTLSSPDQSEAKPEIPARPAKKTSSEYAEKPSLPERPKPRQSSADDSTKSAVSDKSKPQVPARPARSSSGDNKDEAAAKSKPPVPKRPAGGKIAALQAGFMNDLNQRLQLGPHAPKKAEPQEPEPEVEEKEKLPLADARKGRARGPQRRAPAKSPSGSAEAPKPSVPTFTFSFAQSSWSIDPEVGDVAVDSEEKTKDLPVESADKEEATEVTQPEVASDPAPSANVEQPQPNVDVAKPIIQEDSPAENATESQPVREEKTLVANTAGESILETTVEKKDQDQVDPVSVQEDVKA